MERVRAGIGSRLPEGRSEGGCVSHQKSCDPYRGRARIGDDEPAHPHPRRHRRARLAAPDRRARPAGPRGAGRRAALRAGRHRRGRPPRPGAAGRARRRRHGHDARRLARHRARLRHHRPRRPPLRRRRPGRRRRRGRPGVLAGVRRRPADRGRHAVRRPARWPGPRRRRGEVADAAAQWLRIAALGAPGLLLAAAGNGWMRGVQDTRRPLCFVLGANLLSAVLCPLLVYPAGLGLVGSAVANVVAQTLAGVLFAGALVARAGAAATPPRRDRAQQLRARPRPADPRRARSRPASCPRPRSRPASAPPPSAAHQIALQLWFFTALVLDARGHRRAVAGRRRARRRRRGRRAARWPAGSR